MTRDPLKALFSADAQLDDLTRVRMWNALAPALDAPGPRRRRYWPIAAVAVAAAAVAVFVVLSRRDVTREHVVPTGAALAMPLGPATRAVVEGPGELRVVREGDVTAVELRRGTFYGEFTGGHGRVLRIAAAGATIEIIGTLFAVGVVDDTACLTVAHGRVRMTSAGADAIVDGGHRACSTRGQPPGPVVAVDPESLASLVRYQHTWLGDPVVATIAAPVTPQAPTVEASSPVTSSKPSVETPKRTALDASPPAEAPKRAVVDRPAPVEAPKRLDEDLYRAADAALAAGDPAKAEQVLAALVEGTPDSPLADQARYERARLAFDRHDWATVRAHVAEMRPGSPLAEPAAYLGCRAAREIGDREAHTCLDGYLAMFPRAAHAVDALVQLVDIAFRAGGCDAIGTPLATLRAASPSAPAVQAWERRCP